MTNNIELIAVAGVNDRMSMMMFNVSRLEFATAMAVINAFPKLFYGSWPILGMLDCEHCHLYDPDKNIYPTPFVDPSMFHPGIQEVTDSELNLIISCRGRDLVGEQALAFPTLESNRIYAGLPCTAVSSITCSIGK